MTDIQKKMNPLGIILLLSSGFFVLFLVASAVLFLGRSRSTSPRSSSALFASGGTVGVIELNGVIMDSKKTLKKLEEFEEDSQVRAVVLRINSPGGAVAPSQEIYEAVKEYKKPVVASMGSVAASGGYYIAMGAKKVYANAGTITGSIGVIMEFANLERLYEWAKIKRYAIKTGKFKDSGTDTRDMTPDERALLQGMVDDVLKQFKAAVATGRKLTPAQVDAVADGRIFSGAQAKEKKLVDEIGTLKEAVKAAATLAGIKGKPNVVYPERSKRSLMEYLMSGDGEEGEESEAASQYGPVGQFGTLGRLLNGVLGGVSGMRNSPQAAFGQGMPGIYWLWTGTL